ncbi:ATP-binding protein [Candidatus Pelagibacter bacterium nBUS_36]|uniref:ATP-binding protein n=1 Tax=Candidatus Pelagibacter bacterium nBUS_36 TaxID=3374194 RepID=UPI003EB95DDD
MNLAFILRKIRSRGYTLEQSLAELADNSITYNAKNIWTYMYWSDDQGKDSFIMVIDDGDGMNKDVLLNRALNIPKDEHVDKGENDHSVYGLGLKAGSFNHCTSITVITKKDELIKKTLNLKDGVTDNMPSCIEHKFVKKHLEDLNSKKSGTIILWSDLDNLAKLRASERGPNFYEDCDKAKKHFKLIYHKYLLENKINLFFNGTEDVNKTKKFDPFYKDNPNTIILPGSKISFLKGGTTKITPYIIPIDTTNENLGKTRNELQGLYFLRKNRVIDYGGWFGLGEKNADKFWGINERFNRLRIEIEIPIETSKDWITDSKNQVNIPGYAYSKIRKCLIQIRKDYLEKINLMNGENKEPINETSKKKNELIRMLKNSVLNEDELIKIENSIKGSNE